MLLSGLVSLRAGHPGMVVLVHIWHRELRVSLRLGVFLSLLTHAYLLVVVKVPYNRTN